MIYCVPASEIADKLGTTKATNMVMLGALLELTHTLPKESAIALLKAKVRNKSHCSKWTARRSMRGWNACERSAKPL